MMRMMRWVWTAVLLTMVAFSSSAASAETAAKPSMELAAPAGPMAEDAPGLRVGDMAPDFEAMTALDLPVRLSQLYSDGPVVLIFYRGAWCPYCNLHLRSFQERILDFNDKAATVLAISVDKAEFAEQVVRQNSLGFSVVTDPDAKILEAYKVMYKVPDELAAKYRDEYGIDLEKHSGRTDHVIAVPATYAIDTTGKIVFAYANPDYKTRATPEQVLAAI